MLKDALEKRLQISDRDILLGPRYVSRRNVSNWLPAFLKCLHGSNCLDPRRIHLLMIFRKDIHPSLPQPDHYLLPDPGHSPRLAAWYTHTHTLEQPSGAEENEFCLHWLASFGYSNSGTLLDYLVLYVWWVLCVCVCVSYASRTFSSFFFLCYFLSMILLL